MNIPQLSEGSLAIIMKGGTIDSPIMQILSFKKLAPSGNSDNNRYRILLSDGRSSISYAMFASKEPNIESNLLESHSVVSLKNYTTTVLNNAEKGNNRILLILDMELVMAGSKVGVVIGSPSPLKEEGPKSTPQINHTTSSKTVPASNRAPSMSDQQNSTTTLNTSRNSSLGSHTINTISCVSPYFNQWVLRVRVTNKSAVRSWSNSRGEGKLFSVDFLDDSGEIRCTAFRDMVDKYYEMLQIDKVYYVTKCQVKPANKQFNTLKNDYEMTMTNDTRIEECLDTDSMVPQVKYDFVTIDKIAVMEVGTMVDTIGVCKSSTDLQVFVSKNGRELRKRELTLVDQSNTGITFTLWGSDAESFNPTNNPVVVTKGAKITEFGGAKSLSAVMSTQVKINPDISECYRMKGWYDFEGNTANINNVSSKMGGSGSFATPWMTFKEARDNGLGNSEKGDYYQVLATILLVRTENAIYKACPSEECNKKVIDMENGMYRCDKCNQEYPNFKYRLLVNMHLGDWTGSQWVTMFTSEAEKVLGMTSDTLGKLMETNSDAASKVFESVTFKQFIIKCRAKVETYNDESRLKTVAVRVDAIDNVEYNKYLIDCIEQLRA